MVLFCMSSLVAGVAAVICLVILLMSLPRAGLLNKAPLTPIGRLRPGYFSVEGVVLPMEVIKAPVTNKFCVFCNYKIQVYTGGKNAHWETKANIVKLKNFLVTDGTGEIMVNPSRATVEFPWTVAASRISGRFLDLIKKHRIPTKTWLGFERRMRCMECKIRPDDKVTVIGSVGKDPAVPLLNKLLMGKGPGRAKYLITPKPYQQMKNKLDKTIKGAAIGTLIFTVLTIFLMVISYATEF